MHLAFHLYHVSALACESFEKFRSGPKEIQPETSRATGGKTLNEGWSDSCTADLSGFPSKNKKIIIIKKHLVGSYEGT